MPPPPATPTPHRFLVPKRSQPRGETPKPVFQPSSQQFHATPRFSLHSTPLKGPPSSSSLTPFRHRGTGRDVVIDSSPPSSPGVSRVNDDDDDDNAATDDDDHAGRDQRYERGRIGYDQDSVVDGDELVQDSSPIRVGSDGEDHGRNEERSVKRRRISVSPPGGVEIEETSPLPAVESKLDVEMQDAIPDIDSVSEPTVSDNDMDSDTPVLQDSIGNTGERTPHHTEEQPSKPHQPTFQKAPRFKPTEFPKGAPRPEPLPDAFSPRRKGAKYIPGGLAAELRDWLVDVEAGIGSGSASRANVERDEEWVTRIQVNELCDANGGTRGMTLVLGRQVLGCRTIASRHGRVPDTTEDTAEALRNNTIKLILAGPGRLSGLGVGSKVRPGVLIGIARPTWEIALDGLGCWAVACDWAVLG
ncbi:hypothetical protein GGR55DRAFT_677546 [Xylaria sp. FL0064]|nr:hypothetical protein GGR55DRAFT_677546 [Xylaria sp. FL0064]